MLKLDGAEASVRHLRPDSIRSLRRGALAARMFWHFSCPTHHGASQRAGEEITKLAHGLTETAQLRLP